MAIAVPSLVTRPVRHGPFRRWLALLVVGLPSLAACRPAVDGVTPRLTAELRGDTLHLESEGLAGARLLVLASRPWTGPDPLVGAAASLRLWHEAPSAEALAQSVVASAEPPPGTLAVFDLPVADIAGARPVALQIVAQRADPALGPPLAFSEAWVVEPTAAAVRCVPYATWALHGSWQGLLLAGLLALLLVLLATRRLGPAHAWARGNTVVLVLTLIAAVIARAFPGGDWREIAAGYHTPPLVPPTGFERDPIENWHGEGMRALADTVRTQQRDGEAVTIVYAGPSTAAWYRAAHLVRRVPGATVQLDGQAVADGLVVFVDVAPTGTTILVTKAGTLARIGGR